QPAARQRARGPVRRGAVEGRLVVGDEGQGGAVGAFEAEAERRPGMADELGADRQPGDLERARGGVVEGEPAGKFPQADGEQRWREVPGEPVVEAVGGRRRPPQVDLEARLVERPEEAEADDVVHVEVGQQDVDPPQPAGRPVDGPDPGPGVEDAQRPRLRPHLDARRVAAVAGGLGPGAGHRTADAPEVDVHWSIGGWSTAGQPRFARPAGLSGHRRRHRHGGDTTGAGPANDGRVARSLASTAMTPSTAVRRPIPTMAFLDGNGETLRMGADWPLLRSLTEEDRRRGLSAARRRRFGRLDVLFREGDPGDTLHLIDKGRVAIRISTFLGATATVGVLGRGDVVGEMAVLEEGGRRGATVMA